MLFTVQGADDGQIGFEVTPPPLGANQLPIAPGQDAYVLLTPNSQCP